VILVRHAMPEVERGVSSRLWRLGESAKEDCVLLAHALPQNLAPTVYSSDQPKVVETASVIALRRGLSVDRDARFAEVDQGSRWIEDDYRGVAARYLGGFDEPDWEPRERVAARFAAGIANACTRGKGLDTVVVNHGLALSLWLASVLDIDLVAFWRGLTFPDAWAVDVQMGTIERVFLGGVAGE
jgi:broad specificity phosphatase PhoE